MPLSIRLRGNRELSVDDGLTEAFVVPASQAIFVSAGRTVGMGLNQMGGAISFLSGFLIGVAAA